MFKSLLLFSIIVTFSVFVISDAYGVDKAEFQPPITAMVDKTVYRFNDTITIFGNVQNHTADNHPVFIRVFNPKGELYRYDSTKVNDDSTFIYKMQIIKNISGEYKIQAFYNDSWALTRFMFISEPYDLIIHNINYPIDYIISLDGELNQITANTSENSITANITSKASGQFTITLPRSVIDSRKNNLDTDFVIMINSATCTKCPLIANVTEIDTNALTRTLKIDYPYGESLGPGNILNIKIIGSHIIPEFPAGSLVVMLISCFGIIFISSKFYRRHNIP